MKYKKGDPISGVVYKNDEPIGNVKRGTVDTANAHTSLALQAYQFTLFTDHHPALEINDKCRFVTDDGEMEVDVVHVGALPANLFSTIFVFMQPHDI